MGGTITDVMPRYCLRPAAADKLRIPVMRMGSNGKTELAAQPWIHTVLAQLSPVIAGGNLSEGERFATGECVGVVGRFVYGANL